MYICQCYNCKNDLQDLNPGKESTYFSFKIPVMGVLLFDEDLQVYVCPFCKSDEHLVEI